MLDCFGDLVSRPSPPFHLIVPLPQSVIIAERPTRLVWHITCVVHGIPAQLAWLPLAHLLLHRAVRRSEHRRQAD